LTKLRKFWKIGRIFWGFSEYIVKRLKKLLLLFGHILGAGDENFGRT
jgi:hypothetical protein